MINGSNSIKSIWTRTNEDYAKFMTIEYFNGDIVELNMNFYSELYGIDLMSDEGQQELAEILEEIRND